VQNYIIYIVVSLHHIVFCNVILKYLFKLYVSIITFVNNNNNNCYPSNAIHDSVRVNTCVFRYRKARYTEPWTSISLLSLVRRRNYVSMSMLMTSSIISRFVIGIIIIIIIILIIILFRPTEYSAMSKVF